MSEDRNKSIEFRERWLAFSVNFLPFIGFLTAMFVCVQKGSFGWFELGFFLPMYFLCEVGAEVGHHRYFSHKAFEPNRPIKLLLIVLASMTGKGSIFEFAAVHRRHHKFSDQQGDPHSPYEYGQGIWNRWRGFWHGYFGWLLSYPMRPSEHARVIDLLQDRDMVKYGNKNMYYFWLLLGLLFPAIIGFIFWGIDGLVTGFLWGGLVRVFFEQQSAYMINTVCHIWGQRPYKTNDMSTNNILLAYLTFGVGWHNNHHAFPYTADNQFEWWQADPCGWIIKFWQHMGWVKGARKPTLEQRRSKLVVA